MHRFGIVLLAAGNSSRMGSPKQLLPYEGEPLIRRAARSALASACTTVVVVLGAEANGIRPALDGLPVTIVENTNWAQGMGTSIRAGIEAAAEAGLDGAILSLADQPLITAEILNRLVETHVSSGQPIVASRYASTVGVPVFFAKDRFGDLLALRPGQGCKGVILAHENESAVIDCPEAEIDIDTPDDYARIAALSSEPELTAG